MDMRVTQRFGLGQPVRRVEDRRFLCGQGQYVDDIVLPRMVHAAILFSPHAHARITDIDTSAALAAAASDVHLSTGGSHGDFTPWNLAVVEDRVLVWDWERFRTGVPQGTDLLHHALQEDLVARLAEPRESARRVLAEAADRLAPLGVARISFGPFLQWALAARAKELLARWA